MPPARGTRKVIGKPTVTIMYWPSRFCGTDLVVGGGKCYCFLSKIKDKEARDEMATILSRKTFGKLPVILRLEKVNPAALLSRQRNRCFPGKIFDV